MRGRTCEQRGAVQSMLLRGQWPAGCPEELRAHIAVCRGCAELALVGVVMVAAKSAAVAEARLEPAELVWWRAQLRKRQSAMERVGRPIQKAQIFTVALALFAAITLAVLLSLDGWQGWFAEGVLLMQGSELVIVSAAMLALLMGVAVYLTVEQE